MEQYLYFERYCFQTTKMRQNKLVHRMSTCYDDCYGRRGDTLEVEGTKLLWAHNLCFMREAYHRLQRWMVGLQVKININTTMVNLNLKTFLKSFHDERHTRCVYSRAKTFLKPLVLLKRLWMCHDDPILI